MSRPINGLMIGGAVLILLGLLGFAIPIFETVQTKEVAKVGDLKLQKTESTAHVIPQAASGGAVLLGALVMGAGFYRKR